jgi:hypothetical protein
MKPSWEAPPVMPDWWIRQPEMLGTAMDDILSVHDVSRGQAPAGVESGIALSILSENDDTPVGALAKELGECWGRAASMVLELWEANVQTPASRGPPPRRHPEVIEWTGGDLMGQTTAIVPLDSVMPRSRAAQAAYAMQLYDRKILTTPTELAKVADLPDQDDLVAGIDPDTARAQRENYQMSVGFARTVDEIDDHNNHLKIHRDFMRSERYEYLPGEVQTIIRQHQSAHQLYAAQQAAAQTTAASVSPIAATLPTAATKVLDPAEIEKAKSISEQAPSSAGSPAPDAAPATSAPAPQPSYPTGGAQPPAPPGEGGEMPPTQAAEPNNGAPL